MGHALELRVTHIRKALPTAEIWALVRLIAGMSTSMNGQGTTLNEGLLAWAVVARVGPFVGVDTVVSL